MTHDDDFPTPLKDRFYIRVKFPIENALLKMFGRRQPCGCQTLFGRRLRICLTHAVGDTPTP